MFCSSCGVENQDGSTFCSSCGAGLSEPAVSVPAPESNTFVPPPAAPVPPPPAAYIPPPAAYVPPPAFPAVNCMRCGVPNVSFQPMEEKKHSIILGILLLFWIGLIILYYASTNSFYRAFIAAFGHDITAVIWIIGGVFLLLFLVAKKKKVVTYAVCQSCGNRWKAKK